MFFWHKMPFDESDTMLSGRGTFPGQGLLNQAFRERLYLLVCFSRCGNDRVKIPVADMPDNASLDIHVRQKLLGIFDQIRQADERDCGVGDGEGVPRMSIDNRPVQVMARL